VAAAPAAAAPAPPARPTPAPAQPSAPPARPTLSPSEVASRVRPVVGSRPAASSPSSPRAVKTLPFATTLPVREPAAWYRPEPLGSIEYNDDLSTEVLHVRSPERRAPQGRPAVHTVPAKQETTQVTAAPPRRFAKGTSPVTPTRPGMPVVRPRAQADDPTATDIALADRTAIDLAVDEHTTPNLPLSERTKPGITLPTVRGRLAR
jgi:hypothetical protein